MGEIGTLLLMLALVVALPANIYYHRKLQSLITALKIKLPEQYEALHRPHLGFGMSLKNLVAILGYIIKKKHRTSGVDVIAKEGDHARFGFLLTTFLGLVVILSAFLIMWSSK